jgi:hypothetical protein
MAPGVAPNRIELASDGSTRVIVVSLGGGTDVPSGLLLFSRQFVAEARGGSGTLVHGARTRDIPALTHQKPRVAR